MLTLKCHYIFIIANGAVDKQRLFQRAPVHLSWYHVSLGKTQNNRIPTFSVKRVGRIALSFLLLNG